MTIFTDDYEMSKELARVTRVLGPATAYLVRSPARIVDLTELSEGDDECDYFVPVPVERLHEMDHRISDLKFDVRERFGVTITIMPMSVGADSGP